MLAFADLAAYFDTIGARQLEDELYTVAEIAAKLKISADKVTRMFEDEPGVIDLGAPELMHKRRYRLLRIPGSVLNRILQKRRIK
jgi:AraC-like DNA-binding protein